MNKKILFTCVLLVMLALIATGCKLPASGTPPAITTQEAVQPGPTSGGGVVVEPTNTSIPPTPVVVINTPLPPTPVIVTATSVPPTAVPPTPVPPPFTPPPTASRIEFVVGGTSAVVNGEVDSGQTFYYVLRALGAQTMNVKIASPNGDVYLGVFGAEGQELLNSSTQNTLWSGTLPTTQDYYLGVTAGAGRSSYTLTVDIPPLVTGPTPNTTPVAGAFDPVAIFGVATFEDKMTGDNISDWTNPTTGLLPDTKYIHLAETDDALLRDRQAGRIHHLVLHMA